MFILIYGQDDFRARKKLKKIVQEHQGRIQFKLSPGILDSGKFSFQRFRDELRQSPMFKEPIVTILRGAFSDLEFRTKFLEQGESLIKNKEKDNLFIFWEREGDFLTNNLLRFFKKQGKIYKFDFLKLAELKNWTKEEIISQGGKISVSTLTFLVNSTGSDLWRLSTEIKKLVAYKGKSEIIEKKDVELLVRPKIETAIFKTIDAIATKNKKIALTLLYSHLEKGDSPLYLLSMIIYQFRNLLLVKDSEGKSLEEMTLFLKPMHPFVVRKSLWLSKKFTKQELEKIYVKLFQIDLSIKTGKIKPELALELLIADI